MEFAGFLRMGMTGGVYGWKTEPTILEIDGLGLTRRLRHTDSEPTYGKTEMSAQSLQSPLVLIADDQADVLEALRLLLRRAGFSVETVSSPAAVLDALRLRTYDSLLIDLNYARDTTSGREGMELLSRVQELDKTLPTIVMTGWGSIEVAVEAMQHGAREFIQKPWDNERLLALLHKQIAMGKIMREKQQLKLQKRREVLMAAEAQQRLRPKQLPEKSALEFFAACQPAREVGGDYYDFIELDQDVTGFVVADVEGKGMPAALLVSMIQAAVRSYAQRDAGNPGELVASVNDLLRTSADATSYSSLFYAEVDETKRTLRYVNAGHNPPLLLRRKAMCASCAPQQSLARDGRIERLETGGPVIGLFEDCVYEEGTIPLESGDLIVAYTDGLTEAFNSDGEEYEEYRLRQALIANAHLPASELGEKVLRNVLAWRGYTPQHDDLTLLIMKMK